MSFTTSPIVAAFRKLSRVRSRPNSLRRTTTLTEVMLVPPKSKKFFCNTSWERFTPRAPQIILNTLDSMGSSFCRERKRQEVKKNGEEVKGLDDGRDEVKGEKERRGDEVKEEELK